MRKGESLGKIAAKYGVTVNQIKQANDLSDTKIQIGQSLKIPQNKAKQSNTKILNATQNLNIISLLNDSLSIIYFSLLYKYYII